MTNNPTIKTEGAPPPPPPFVKICGVRDQATITRVARAGADAVGFVVDVPGSPRNLSVDAARDLVARVPASLLPVVVSRVHDPDEIRALARAFPRGRLQLHAPLGLAELARLPREVLARFLLPLKVADAQLLAEYDRTTPRGPLATIPHVILDGSQGRGKTCDLSATERAVAALAGRQVIIAGGLTPANVVATIRSTRPFGVDVSSGVERAPGVKDPRKMHEFVHRAKHWRDTPQVRSPNHPDQLPKSRTYPE